MADQGEYLIGAQVRHGRDVLRLALFYQLHFTQHTPKFHEVMRIIECSFATEEEEEEEEEEE